MNQIPVSLQMWSVRDDFRVNFARTVQEVAKVGFAGIELAGYGNLTASEAQKAISQTGLRVSGMHVAIDGLRTDLSRVLEEAELFGTRHIICPWMDPDKVETRQQCETFGEELNRLGAKLAASGLLLSYHNHAQEFKVIEGRHAFEWILDAAEPRYLAAELDVYWAFSVGVPPESFLQRQGARVPLIHLKDGKDGKQSEIGKGGVDFQAIFTAAERIGSVEWYVVEQEEYNQAPMESIRLCFQQLQAWGRA